jgi:hypothetical protein
MSSAALRLRLQIGQRGRRRADSLRALGLVVWLVLVEPCQALVRDPQSSCASRAGPL